MLEIQFLGPISFNLYQIGMNVHVDGILPTGPYPPCFRVADRALLAGYPWCVIGVKPKTSQMAIGYTRLKLLYHIYLFDITFN